MGREDPQHGALSLWPPVWRFTALVTNPVDEGRGGIPPGRAQWPQLGFEKCDSHTQNVHLAVYEKLLSY